MPAAAQHLINQIADGRFPLRKLLGVSPNSAVFLTSAAPARPRDPNFDAAIKLIPEDPATSEAQLEHWRTAAALSHPGLLRIFYWGRCVIDGSPCLYVVTEFANEDLGQLLPRRALTPDETRGMLASVLPTLDFLHEHGLVHAGLKPSNIHATGDNVKLAADRILPAGESASMAPLAAPFVAPESVLFPASDIWSLGITLCETLTKILPERKPSGRFALPDLPAPFAEIIRSALAEDATLRISLDQVRSLLDPSFVAKRKAAGDESSDSPANQAASGLADTTSADPNVPAVASPYVRPPEAPDSPESILAAAQAGAASAATRPSASRSTRVAQREPLPQIDPLAVPLSPVSPKASPIPVSSLPQVNATIGSSRRVPAPLPTSSRSNKLFLVSAAAAVLLAILVVPRLLRSPNSSAPASSATRSPAPSSIPRSVNDGVAKANSAKTGASNENPANSRAASTPAGNPAGAATKAPLSPAKSAPAADSSAHSAPSPSRNSSTANSALSSPTTNSSPNSKSSAPANPPSSAAIVTHAPSDVNPASPIVLRKVLPEVSEKSRSTIRGTVRINVRVQLNPDGTVSSAELANPAPSQFFANLALKAARQWQFTQPSGASEPSPSPVIRFDFTQTSTSAYIP